jgi:hypothetical protein
VAPSKLTAYLVRKLDSSEKKAMREDREISPLISEFASWYEKLRNAMEYRDEEVVLRAAIERILKRRLIFGNPTTIAKTLVHELIWAKYFPETGISEEKIDEIEERIALYLQLEKEVSKRHKGHQQRLSEWMFHLLSTDIEQRLRTSQEKELLCNYIYQIFRQKINIADDTDQVRDVQVYIASQRLFAKADLAMLRFALIGQMYGEITQDNVALVAEEFPQAQQEIDLYLRSPYKDKISGYIKRHIPAFFILEGVFLKKRGEVEKLLKDEDELGVLIEQECAQSYEIIHKKVSTAIIRSVIFIFMTKAVFALTLETTFEQFLFGSVSWPAIIINVLSAPVLMLSTTVLIKTPDKENTRKIVKVIKEILYQETPSLARPLLLDRKRLNPKASLLLIYSLLWFVALTLGLLAINWGLNRLGFNPVSKIVFVFFLAVVSFMSYRINQSARAYTITREKQGIGSAFFDFFFVPFIQIGKYLTLGVSQINIFLFIFDYLIETPFKEMFVFLEQWLFFLRSQRETID